LPFSIFGEAGGAGEGSAERDGLEAADRWYTDFNRNSKEVTVVRHFVIEAYCDPVHDVFRLREGGLSGVSARTVFARRGSGL
jgi:hypothetical protein